LVRASASTSKSSTEPQGEPDRLVVGTIVGHFGVGGELKVVALDASAFETGRVVLVDVPGAGREAKITGVRSHQKNLLVRLGGVDDVKSARALRGASILVDRTALEPAGPGAFRTADLIGFEVRDARLGSLGSVRDVRRYPACDMLVVGEPERLVPMLRAYEFTVDRKRRVIAVRLPPGFEEL
jgi:16S rRNA processing protein RimM